MDDKAKQNPWDKVWVDSYEYREVFSGDIRSFAQVREILQEVDELAQELGEGWHLEDDITAYGEEDAAFVEGWVRFRRKLTKEEIEAAKKAAWEKSEQNRLERERREAEKDFAVYQALKKKFENLGQDVL